jgi:L-cysteine S-thiosulfotransferase
LLSAMLAAPANAADVANGRKIVEDRTLSACLLCHSGPFPAPHLQGNLGPSLDGVADRLSEAEIRQRIENPSRSNPDTVMPAYAKIDGLNRVGAAWRGKPILTPAQIDDVVAFLATLHGP